MGFLNRVSELADSFAVDIWNVNHQLQYLYPKSDVKGAIVIPAARRWSVVVRDDDDPDDAFTATGVDRSYLVQLRTGEGSFCYLCPKEYVKPQSKNPRMIDSDGVGDLYWSKQRYLPSEPEKIPENVVQNLNLRTRLSPFGTPEKRLALGDVWSFWKFHFWKDLNSIYGAKTHEETFALRKGYSYDLEAVLKTIPCS